MPNPSGAQAAMATLEGHAKQATLSQKTSDCDRVCLRSVLESLKADLEAGKSCYKSSSQAVSTAHSSLSTATGFMTPAHATSQRTAHPQTPTLELTAKTAVSLQHLNFTRAANLYALQSYGCKLQDSKSPDKREPSGRSTAAKAAEKREQEALTVVVRAATAHTGASMATGHSLSSEEATYTLHGNARAAASPVTGHRRRPPGVLEVPLWHPSDVHGRDSEQTRRSHCSQHQQPRQRRRKRRDSQSQGGQGRERFESQSARRRADVRGEPSAAVQEDRPQAAAIQHSWPEKDWCADRLPPVPVPFNSAKRVLQTCACRARRRCLSGALRERSNRNADQTDRSGSASGAWIWQRTHFLSHRQNRLCAAEVWNAKKFL